MLSSYKTRAYRGIILTAMVLGVSGCGSMDMLKETPPLVDDAMLKENVKAALRNEDALKGYDLFVDSKENEIILGGFVQAPFQRLKAEELAQSVKGVRSVSNGILVS